MPFLILLTLLFTSFTSFAAKYAIVIGGSGEDFKKENFFLNDFARFNASLKKRGFEVTNIFDSSKTDGKFESVDAKNKNIEAAIKELENKIKKGDEVAIIVHTHGLASGLNFGGIAHNVLTESGRYHLGGLMPFVEQVKIKLANAVVIDLSCYSGTTQNMLRNSYNNKNREKLGTNTCVLTAAAENYVSICSGDPSSNSFTAALLDELEKSGSEKVSAEKLFLRARTKDASFTNMPQISSFTAPLEGTFDYWLKNTDPAGLNEEINEDENTSCENCEYSSPNKRQNEAINELAKNLKPNRNASAILNDYKTAIKLQPSLQNIYAMKAMETYKQLIKQEKYKVINHYKLSQIIFYASLENIPTLFKTDDTLPEMSDEAIQFLKKYNYIDPTTKMGMLASVDSKTTLHAFMQDFNKAVATEKSARDQNRNKIQDLAAKILQMERKAYSAKFKSKKGNACQNFSF